MKYVIALTLIIATGMVFAYDEWADIIGDVYSNIKVNRYEIYVDDKTTSEHYGDPYYLRITTGTHDVLCICYWNHTEEWRDTINDVYFPPYDTTTVNFSQP